MGCSELCRLPFYWRSTAKPIDQTTYADAIRMWRLVRGIRGDTNASWVPEIASRVDSQTRERSQATHHAGVQRTQCNGWRVRPDASGKSQPDAIIEVAHSHRLGFQSPTAACFGEASNMGKKSLG